MSSEEKKPTPEIKIEELTRVEEPKKAEEPKKKPEPKPFVFKRNLTLGDKGADVRELQKRLGIKQTGVVDAKTRNAVREFRIKHKLFPSKVADDEVFRRL